MRNKRYIVTLKINHHKRYAGDDDRTGTRPEDTSKEYTLEALDFAQAARDAERYAMDGTISGATAIAVRLVEEDQ